MIAKSTPASPKVVAAAAVLGVAAFAAFAFGGSSQAVAAAPSAETYGSLASPHDGIDWSKVAVVPASPAQSVAAYDR